MRKAYAFAAILFAVPAHATFIYAENNSFYSELKGFPTINYTSAGYVTSTDFPNLIEKKAYLKTDGMKGFAPMLVNIDQNDKDGLQFELTKVNSVTKTNYTEFTGTWKMIGKDNYGAFLGITGKGTFIDDQYWTVPKGGNPDRVDFSNLKDVVKLEGTFENPTPEPCTLLALGFGIALSRRCGKRTSRNS